MPRDPEQPWGSCSASLTSLAPLAPCAQWAEVGGEAEQKQDVSATRLIFFHYRLRGRHWAHLMLLAVPRPQIYDDSFPSLGASAATRSRRGQGGNPTGSTPNTRYKFRLVPALRGPGVRGWGRRGRKGWFSQSERIPARARKPAPGRLTNTKHSCLTSGLFCDVAGKAPVARGMQVEITWPLAPGLWTGWGQHWKVFVFQVKELSLQSQGRRTSSLFYFNTTQTGSVSF